MSEIDIEHLDFGYTKGVPILQDFNLSIQANEFVFVLGANGSGKSSLLKLILGAISPQKGHLRFDQKLISNKKRASLLGYVPQNYSLDPEMSVQDTLQFIASLHKLNRSDFTKRKKELSYRLGFDHLLNKQVKKLSGGQKQLVNIALGILHDPPIVLLDEPFVGLDYGIKSNVIAYLNGLKKTVLCVSHDLEMAENYAHKILLLKKGVAVAFQAPKEMINAFPSYLKEIDFKQTFEENVTLDSAIAVVQYDNRLILSCANNSILKDKIVAFESEHMTKISGTRSAVNNLKSTLVAQHQFSISEHQKGKGEKAGKGRGKAKNRKNL